MRLPGRIGDSAADALRCGLDDEMSEGGDRSTDGAMGDSVVTIAGCGRHYGKVSGSHLRRSVVGLGWDTSGPGLAGGLGGCVAAGLCTCGVIIAGLGSRGSGLIPGSLVVLQG